MAQARTLPSQQAAGKAPAASAGAPDPQHFRAVLERDGTSLNWTVARLPFTPAAVWTHLRRARVCGTINGVPFRTSLFPAGAGRTGHVLLVNKTLQRAAGVSLGMTAEFTLEPDFADRPSSLPAGLVAAFGRDRKLLRWTEALSESTRREIGKWIAGVKSPEAQGRRAAQMAERLLLAMEGERELPPLLAVLLRETPSAHAGWLALTPAQRRSHLLGIFYYQSPAARETRARKAVEDALRIASSSDKPQTEAPGNAKPGRRSKETK